MPYIFITSIPRYAIECLCLIFLSIVYFSLTKLGGKFEFSIAILGTFALGSQRLCHLCNNYIDLGQM